MARMSGIRPFISRRSFLGAGAAWLGGMPLARGMENRKVRTVSIFHTTDLHGHILPTVTYEGIGDVGGMARCATQIRRWRKECPDSILVDIGDVWQGTPAGFATKGRLMVDLFNRLDYDAWVLGNHDFDWGRDKTEAALAMSTPHVLTANLSVDGKAAGTAGGAWDKVKPWTIKEVAGFRIGLIGLITPGLPFWLTPKTLNGVAALDPVATLARCVAEVKAANADAVVVLGHMGWRPRDDYANPVHTMLTKVEGIDLYLAGHSHQDQPSWMTGNVLCSQAGYHGIHCGRVDLAFDVDSRKLVNRRAFTVLMDSRFEPDPLVMETARPELDSATERLARPVWTVSKTIPGQGRGSGVWKLFCEAFAGALERQGEKVDGIFHGTFGTGDIEPGVKTVGDCWKWLPYENEFVVAELGVEELARIVAEDRRDQRSDRGLWPFDVTLDDEGKIVSFRHRGGEVPPDRRFRIAFNSYDAQSGGRRLMALREILERPESNRRDTGIAAREALIGHLLAL